MATPRQIHDSKNDQLLTCGGIEVNVIYTLIATLRHYIYNSDNDQLFICGEIEANVIYTLGCPETLYTTLTLTSCLSVEELRRM